MSGSAKCYGCGATFSGYPNACMKCYGKKLEKQRATKKDPKEKKKEPRVIKMSEKKTLTEEETPNFPVYCTPNLPPKYYANFHTFCVEFPLCKKPKTKNVWDLTPEEVNEIVWD